MSEEAVRLYKVAIDAYVEQDASLAAALDDMDDELDSIHKDYIEAIFESHHASNLGLEAAVQLALIGRYYERIGDHAVNIGNRVEYMVTGLVARAQRCRTSSGQGRPAERTAASDAENPRLRLADDA